MNVKFGKYVAPSVGSPVEVQSCLHNRIYLQRSWQPLSKFFIIWHRLAHIQLHTNTYAISNHGSSNRVCVTFVNFLSTWFSAVLRRCLSSGEWYGRPGKQSLMGQQPWATKRIL